MGVWLLGGSGYLVSRVKGRPTSTLKGCPNSDYDI